MKCKLVDFFRPSHVYVHICFLRVVTTIPDIYNNIERLQAESQHLQLIKKNSKYSTWMSSLCTIAMKFYFSHVPLNCTGMRSKLLDSSTIVESYTKAAVLPT